MRGSSGLASSALRSPSPPGFAGGEGWGEGERKPILLPLPPAGERESGGGEVGVLRRWASPPHPNPLPRSGGEGVRMSDPTLSACLVISELRSLGANT